MKQILYILFVLVALLGISHLDDERVWEGGHTPGYVVEESVDSSYVQELICSREYNGDMLLRSSRTSFTVGQNNLTSLNNSVRSRNESHTKSLQQAIPECHAGHVVHPFNYNRFKSSLHIAYYLYALCRLRI